MNSKNAKILLVYIVASSFLPYKANCCRRRRHAGARPCSRVNCRLSQWSSWSSCSHRCGTSGTQTRSRYKIRHESCGGSCSVFLLENRRCNRGGKYCNEYRGWPVYGRCSCYSGWRGTCCSYGT